MKITINENWKLFDEAKIKTHSQLQLTVDLKELLQIAKKKTNMYEKLPKEDLKNNIEKETLQSTEKE